MRNNKDIKIGDKTRLGPFYWRLSPNKEVTIIENSKHLIVLADEDGNEYPVLKANLNNANFTIFY